MDECHEQKIVVIFGDHGACENHGFEAVFRDIFDARGFVRIGMEGRHCARPSRSHDAIERIKGFIVRSVEFRQRIESPRYFLRIGEFIAPRRGDRRGIWRSLIGARFATLPREQGCDDGNDIFALFASERIEGEGPYLPQIAV